MTETSTVRASASPAHSRPSALSLVALLGAAVGVIGLGWTPVALVGPVIAVPGSVLAWSDLRWRRLPTRWVYGMAGAAVTIAPVVEAVDHRAVGLSVIAGSAVTGLPMLVVHLVTPSGVGFGDVRLAAALGAALGVIDWRLSAVSLVAAVLAGACAGVLHGPWRRSIPLGVFMVSAGLLIVLVGGRVS